MTKKILFLFLFFNSCLFAQTNDRYAFDKITTGKINNTNINSVGNVFLIQNSKNSDYHIQILQYENGNKLAQLFHKDKKRIVFDYANNFSKIEDINKLITSQVMLFEKHKPRTQYLDSISFEIDSVKNELLVRNFVYRKGRKKIHIYKESFQTYSNADDLFKDEEFMKNLNNTDFDFYLRSENLKRFLNVYKNKIHVEINYESSIKHDKFTYLNVNLE